LLWGKWRWEGSLRVRRWVLKMTIIRVLVEGKIIC
jgi:hypothetical protein